MAEQTENERNLVPGRSKGIRRHNRRVKALLRKTGALPPKSAPSAPATQSFSEEVPAPHSVHEPPAVKEEVKAPRQAKTRRS